MSRTKWIHATSERPRIPWRAVVVLYTVLLTVASLLPSGGDTPLSGWDAEISPTVQNVMHLPAYMVFVVLLLLAFAQPVHTTRTKTTILLAVGCIAFGVLMEWLQAIAIPGRTGSLDDALLNTAGVLLGTILFSRLKTEN